MKITVGHILLVVGVGTYAFLGPLEGWEKSLILVGDARNFAAEKLPYMEFLRTPDRRPKAVPVVPAAEKLAPEKALPEKVSVPLEVADKLPAGEALATDKNFAEKALTPVPLTEGRVSDVPPVPEEPAIQVPKKAPAPRRRRKSAKPAAAVSAEQAKAAPGKKSTDNLVGTYVSLTLKTGNAVKGVLVERTATNYKIELPGMGAFDYPANTVKSIAVAE